MKLTIESKRMNGNIYNVSCLYHGKRLNRGVFKCNIDDRPIRYKIYILTVEVTDREGLTIYGNIINAILTE